MVDSVGMDQARFRRVAPVYTWRLTPDSFVADASKKGGGGHRLQQDDPPPDVREQYPLFFRLQDQGRELFFGYCAELDLIHEDLNFIVECELEQEFDFSEGAEELFLHQWRMLYNADNADFRVHAYREKAFKLVNIGLQLGVSDRAGSPLDSSKLDFNHTVIQALARRRFAEIGKLFTDLHIDAHVRQTMERRKLLTHKLAKRDPVLAPKRLIELRSNDVDDIEAVGRLADLDSWRKRKRRELDAICERLVEFRWSLVDALKRAGSA